MGRKRVTMAKMLALLAILTLVSWLLLQLPGFVDFDTNLFLYVNSFYNQNLAVLLNAFTFLGSVWMGFIWVATLFFFKRRDLALYVLVAVLMEIAYEYVAKDLVNRPRPYEALANVKYVAAQFGHSFPSGHAAGAFVIAAVVGMKERWTLLPLVFISVLVALSRVYIGVHYPFDIVGGAIAGSIIGFYVAKMDLSPLQAYFGKLGDRLFKTRSKSPS
ncbi:MAG TPA: phosphatase PAP2 family protein [Methanomassiliicoccales archaeon]|nr:phosphatase PAP2 family protein [Methanomassiliicoccales archaeon]